MSSIHSRSNLILHRHSSSQQKDMSEVIDFYHEKNILITGAAGFLGKLLMEKLLRLCEVRKIYILVRDKRGLIAEDRLESIFQVPVFDRLRQSKPDFLSFIELVKGDVALPGLGLCEEVKALLTEEIDIVFHGAATVNFEDPISKATSVNVYGTKEMALLCQEMKNLKAFVHISTAFANCPNDKIVERFYDPPIETDELIELCSGLNNPTIATEKYLEGWPNTYAFTKCVAEDAIKKYAAGIPTCIVRPAIVTCTKSEPIVGWIDNYYGPAGYIAAVEAGLLRVGFADDRATSELVPADMCINFIIAAAHNTGKSKFVGETKIFNFTSSPQNRLSHGEFVNYFLEAGREAPSAQAYWYPTLTLTKSKIVLSFLSFVYQILPAIILDIILTVFLKEPKALKMSLKMRKFVNALSYFTSRNWTFSNANLTSLWEEMNPTDKILFDFDVNRINWKEYVAIKVHGVRKYLFKQEEESIPSAKKREYWLLVIDRAIHAFLSIIIIIWFTKYCSFLFSVL